MTKGILMVGSSHLGALRMAWEQLEPRPAIDFFGYPIHATDLVGRLKDGSFGLRRGGKARDAALAPAIAFNGRRALDLDAYDRVIHVGHNPGHDVLLKLIASVGVAGIRPLPRPEAPRLSAETWRGLARAIVADAFPRPLLDDLMAPPGTRRVLMVQRPLRSELSVQREDATGEVARALQAAPEGVTALLAEATQMIAELHAGAGIDYLPQDPATIGAFGLTQQRFSRGAVNLQGGEKRIAREATRAARGSIDCSHMNVEYGALVLERVLAWAEG